MRIKQFLELCIHTIAGVDTEALGAVAAKYSELLALWENAMKSWLTENPKDAAAAKEVRKGFDYLLRRSSETEAEALKYWAAAIHVDIEE